VNNTVRDTFAGSTKYTFSMLSCRQLVDASGKKFQDNVIILCNRIKYTLNFRSSLINLTDCTKTFSCYIRASPS